jgi:hypothetical protein
MSQFTETEKTVIIKELPSFSQRVILGENQSLMQNEQLVNFLRKTVGKGNSAVINISIKVERIKNIISENL